MVILASLCADVVGYIVLRSSRLILSSGNNFKRVSGGGIILPARLNARAIPLKAGGTTASTPTANPVIVPISVTLSKNVCFLAFVTSGVIRLSPPFCAVSIAP